MVFKEQRGKLGEGIRRERLKRKEGKEKHGSKRKMESKEEREVKRKKLKKDIHFFYVSRFLAKRIILGTEAVAWTLEFCSPSFRGSASKR